MSSGPALADGVYFCVTERYGVFLDLKRDAYSAVPLSELPAPEAVVPRVGRLLASMIAAHGDELAAAGLITLRGGAGAPLTNFLEIGRPATHVFADQDRRAFGCSGGNGTISVTFADMLRFLVGAVTADFLLRFRHISAIVERVRRRKAAAIDGSIDLAELVHQMSIFRVLRPWFPRRYACLFEALALVEFLASRAIFPDWIFGVQAQPFGAHCWVQKGRMLLNEASEYAGQFTPIMVA